MDAVPTDTHGYLAIHIHRIVYVTLYVVFFRDVSTNKKYMKHKNRKRTGTKL